MRITKTYSVGDNQELAKDELREVPMQPARRISLERAQQLVAENKELLDRLAKHDGPITELTNSTQS